MKTLLQERLARAAALRPAKTAAAMHRGEDLPAAAEELARMVAATTERIAAPPGL